MICPLTDRKHRFHKLFTSLFLVMFCLVFGTGEALHRAYHAFVAPEESPRLTEAAANTCRESHSENCWTTTKEQAGLRNAKAEAPCFVGQLLSKTLTSELFFVKDLPQITATLENDRDVTFEQESKASFAIWLSTAPRGPPTQNS